MSDGKRTPKGGRTAIAAGALPTPDEIAARNPAEIICSVRDAAVFVAVLLDQWTKYADLAALVTEPGAQQERYAALADWIAAPGRWRQRAGRTGHEGGMRR
jgi:hypothetical protein